MKNIFISYQAKDTAISHLFFNALEDKGYDVWLYEEHGYCGIFHRNQVQQVIRESSAFIFIMSENSMLSDEVTFELQTADKENKPIFPVYINRCWEDFLKIKTDWRSILQSRTGINASHDLNKAIDSLVIGLKNEGVLGKSKNHQDNIQQDTSSDRERIVPVVFSGSLDHFINRTNELEMLMNFINDANTRFILLTGPGGYGKSAVIEKLICEITEHYSLDNSIFKCGIDSIVWLDFRAEENRSVDALFNLLNKTFSKGKAIDFINAWNSEPSLSHRLNFLIGRLLTRDKRLIIQIGRAHV